MIKVHVYRQNLAFGYTVDPDAFSPPEGWSHFRTIECFASAPLLGSDRKIVGRSFKRRLPRAFQSVLSATGQAYYRRRHCNRRKSLVSAALILAVHGFYG
jgi:hypothetical protein